MAEEKAFKKIGTVFEDFKNTSNILNAKIQSVNLYKKENAFEVFLISDNMIDIKEVHSFEKFLIRRFSLERATVKINYSETTEVDIRSEWNNIVEYLSYRYPLTKAILRNSEVSIEDNVISTKLHMPGKEFLDARGMNKVFEETLENIYGQKYKINFTENVDNKEIEHFRELSKQREQDAISAIEKQNEENKLQKENKKEESGEDKPQTTNNNQSGESGIPIPPPPDDKNIPKEEVQEEEEEITPLIYGRSQNIKAPSSKIVAE